MLLSVAKAHQLSILTDIQTSIPHKLFIDVVNGAYQEGSMLLIKSPNLQRFHRRATKTKKADETSPAKAFSETSRGPANKFARALCSDLDLFLRQHGMVAAHEKDSGHRGVHRIDAIADSSSTGFQIRADIHILTRDSARHIANLEVKFMPAGMIVYDAKKIVYQFMHLNKQFPQQRNLVVYGGKLIQRNHPIDCLLRTFSDDFIQLATESNSEALAKSFDVCCKKILNTLKKRIRHYSIVPTRQQTAKIMDSLSHRISSRNGQRAVDRRSHDQKKRNGYAFERDVGAILESMEIDFESRKKVEVPVPIGSPISIELDYAILEDEEIKVALECKNSGEIGTKTACNIAFDAMMIRRRYPDAIYLLVLGPDNERWSSPHLRRYVDWILTSDDIPGLIREQFPYLV